MAVVAEHTEATQKEPETLRVESRQIALRGAKEHFFDFSRGKGLPPNVRETGELVVRVRPWTLSMWSATRGWRFGTMGTVSAQLDQYAVVRRRSAFPKFSPPDLNGKLAITTRHQWNV